MGFGNNYVDVISIAIPTIEFNFFSFLIPSPLIYLFIIFFLKKSTRALKRHDSHYYKICGFLQKCTKMMSIIVHGSRMSSCIKISPPPLFSSAANKCSARKENNFQIRLVYRSTQQL
jgi:hypothetical protein